MDVRRRLALSVAAVLCAAALAACSDATTSGPGESPDAAVVTPDVTPDTGPPPPTPVELLTVDTGVSDDGPEAGQTITVFCTVGGLADGQPPPATHWEVYKTPDNPLHAPEIAGKEVTFKSAGQWSVRCIIDATGWIDPTPTKILVYPAEAISVETTVTPDQLGAGQIAEVTCEGTDPYDNVIDAGWVIHVEPGGPEPGTADGLLEANQKLKALTVGTYEVACQQGEGKRDASPALVRVTHGLPYKLVTSLESDTIQAGQATGLSCHAEDKWGNTVPDLPMAVDLPTKLTLTGFAVGGTVSGKYTVRCVPSALDWTAFVLEHAVLEILPGAPVSMELTAQPPKPFYGTFEKITLVAMARDAWDNPVPDAPLLPVEVSPADAPFKQPTEKTLLFTEEGVFTVTGRLADNPSIADSLDLSIEGDPPVLTVDYPARGATIVGFKPSVTVEGTASDQITGINSVRVNGVPASTHPDGTWSTIVIPRWGLNVLEVEATDLAGQVQTVTQSFYFAEKYYPLEPSPWLGDAIKAWLDEQFIDDGVHNPTHPDDLATILEGVAASFDLNSALPPPMEIGLGYALHLSNFSMNPPKLWLDPFNGGLKVTLQAKNIAIKVALKGECKVLGIDLCPDFGGKVQVGILDLDADLLASAKNAVLDVSLANPKVNLEAIDIDIDGILGWLFDWLIDFLVNIFTGTIEDAFEDQIGDLLGDTLAEVLSSLAIAQTLDIPAPLPGMDDISLTLESRVHSLAFTPDGGRLGLGARIAAAKKVAQDIAGSIARGTCLKGYPINWQVPGANDFEVGLFDDVLNLALSAVWYQGVLNLSLDKDTIGELLGDGGTDGFPLPVDGLAISTLALLPPIVNGCDPTGVVKIQIGDMFVDVELVSAIFSGGVGRLGVYVAAEASASITLDDTDEGAALGVTILGVDTLKYHWEYVPEGFEGQEKELEEILETELIDKALADMIGTPLGNFVIPELDLGTLSPLFAEGTVIVPVIEDMHREGGHTLLQGYLE